MRRAVDDLIDLLQGTNGTVDLQPLFFRLTLDTTTAFLFGESVRSFITPEAIEENTFANAFNIAQQWVAEWFRLLGLYRLINGRVVSACEMHRLEGVTSASPTSPPDLPQAPADRMAILANQSLLEFQLGDQVSQECLCGLYRSFFPAL